MYFRETKLLSAVPELTRRTLITTQALLGTLWRPNNLREILLQTHAPSGKVLCLCDVELLSGTDG